MSCPGSLALDPPADHVAPARPLIERQLAMLTRLAEIGMEIAEAAGRRAAALAAAGEAGPHSPALASHAPDPTLAFARAARAVRLTIALQSRLAGDLAALDRGEAAARAAEAATRRDRIHHLVERAIEAACLDDPDHHGADREDEIERLSSHAWERLTDVDDADLTDRPLSETVARICRDLGLPPERFAAAFASEAGSGAALFAEGDPARAPIPVFDGLPGFDPPGPGSGPAFAPAARPCAQSRAPPQGPPDPAPAALPPRRLNGAGSGRAR